MADAPKMVEPLRGADGRRAQLGGVTLRPQPRTFAAGATQTWRFTLAGCDGRALQRFQAESGKRLHLIVVRSDLTAYQHLHPTLHRDGSWSVAVATPAPGRYRAITDFVVDDHKYVLGTDLTVPGPAAQRPLPAPGLTAATDGYGVELQRPAVLRAGQETQLTFLITRGGRPVRDLQPYLASYGHLVALHAPDLAYSHVHPNGTDRSQGAVTFDTELHARGTYRLFLQFQTHDRDHTAAFTQTVR
jgi:hypothetical protein